MCMVRKVLWTTKLVLLLVGLASGEKIIKIDPCCFNISNKQSNRSHNYTILERAFADTEALKLQ